MAGKKVILMEKRAAVGGVSALNHGGLAATGTRYQREVMKETNDSADLLYNDMLKGGDYRNDKVLARMTADRVGEVGNWLIDDLKIQYGAAWVRFPGHSAARQISAKGNSLHWQEQMLDIYKKHGGIIMTDMRAQEFITDASGAVVGVKASGINDQPYEFKAGSYILASRGYYADFVKRTPKDTLVLTLACGKFRFNDMDLGDINGIPRLLDMGQCNDAYSAIKVAIALTKAFDCSVNDLPLSLVLSWYEQKAVSILLTLLYLGIRDIRIGPSLPAFVSSNVLSILVEKFGLKPITTPEEDLKTILGETN